MRPALLAVAVLCVIVSAARADESSTDALAKMQYQTGVRHYNVGEFGTVDTRIYETMTFNATPQPDVYIRAYYYIPAAPTNAANLIGAPGTGGGMGVNYAGGKLAQYYIPSGYKGSATALPTNAWSCIEWHIKQSTDPAVGELHVFLNGAEVSDLATTAQTQPSGGPINAANIGISFYGTANAAAAADYYIDNIIVDSAPIGCSK